MSLIQTPMSKKGGCDVSDIKTVILLAQHLISGPSLLGQHLISGLSLLVQCLISGASLLVPCLISKRCPDNSGIGNYANMGHAIMGHANMGHAIMGNYGACKYGACKYGACKYGACNYGACKYGACNYGACKYGACNYGACTNEYVEVFSFSSVLSSGSQNLLELRTPLIMTPRLSTEHTVGSINRTHFAVPNTLFVYITTPEVRTPH